MTCRKVHTLIALCCLALCGAAQAQTAAEFPADKTVTLEECIRYALDHHSTVKIAKGDLAASRAGLTQARSGLLPQISARHSYDWSKSRSKATETEPSETEIFNGRQTTVQATETLYDGGQTLTEIRRASAGERGAGASLESTLQDRILLVTTAYFNALETRRIADIAAQSVTEAEQQKSLIQTRIDTGDAAPVDIYTPEVQLANAKLQKLQADNEVRIAMTDLKNAMGLVHGPDLRLADVEEPKWQTPALDECLSYALKNRPEMIQSAAQADSSKASLTLARLRRLPVPTLSAGYSRGLSGTQFDDEWFLGFDVTLNIFDGGAAAASVTSAKASYDSAELRKEQTALDIARDVEQAYLNLGNSLERLEASKLNVTLAKTNLDVMNEKYKQGLAIPLEVVSAQVSHADALASYAQALYSSYVAYAQLDNAMGRRQY